ncbi:hypothetical protein ACIO02_35605 [Streptomyces sp. NPDC087568]|uniref:hypothetical protein n=1 Tax=Streptomyces sp. NPDC087568 TaxID=3365799 RepID=UPI00381226E5
MTNRTPPSPAVAEGLREVPAAALELLNLPLLDGLRDGQVRGRHCLWCRRGPLTSETAIDLGEQMSPLSSDSDSSRMRWYPRACRRCIRTRAYRALLDHVHPGPCEPCENAAPGCEIGRALNRLLREGRRR